MIKKLHQLTQNEKGISMPLFALMMPFIALVVIAAINYNFYSGGEIDLDAGTDRAVDIAAVNYGIEGYDERTLLALLDHMDGSTLDKLTKLSIYKASVDEIPGKPASGEEPLLCTQDCVRYEYNSTTDNYDLVMDAWPAGLQDKCQEAVIGITAVIDHENIAPLPFFEGPITLSKVERTNVDSDCTSLGGKAVIFRAIYDSDPGMGNIDKTVRKVPFQKNEDNRNAFVAPGDFKVPETGKYTMDFVVQLNAPLPTSGTLTAQVIKNGTQIGSPQTISFSPSNDSSSFNVRIQLENEQLEKEDLISLQLQYDGTGVLQINPNSETATYVNITQGEQN